MQADGKTAVVRGIYHFLWDLQFSSEAATAATDDAIGRSTGEAEVGRHILYYVATS